MSYFRKYEQGSSWISPSPLRLTMGAGKDAFQLKHYRVKDPNAPRCCASMSDHFRTSQCEAPGKAQDENGDWWCNRHSPAAVARIKAKQDARVAEDKAKRDAQYDIEKRKRNALRDVELFRAALTEIANGHNNAIGLAREILGLDQKDE